MRLDPTTAEAKRTVETLKRASTEGLKALGVLLGANDLDVEVEAELTDDTARLLEMPSETDEAAVIAFELSGGVTGGLLLVLAPPAASVVAKGLLGAAPEGPLSELSAHAKGALSEAGNIVVSAFLNELARVVGKTCLPSIPHFAAGNARSAVKEALETFDTGFAKGADQAVLLTARIEQGVSLEVRLGVIPPLAELSALEAAAP